MSSRAQMGFCIPWLPTLLGLLFVLLSGAEGIRNPGKRLNQFLLPFYPGSLTCGYSVTCGLQQNGTAFCWSNDNSLGQLGTNATTGSIAPVAVSGNKSFIKISAGYSTVCGIHSDLSAWCWGLNDQGQAGTSNESQPVNASLFMPTPLYGNSSWLELDLGNSFGCGIKTDRTLWCWGTSYSGALGNGQLNSTALIPTQITQPSNKTKWNSVACGFDFACAITVNGSLYCWGDNQYGQIGLDLVDQGTVLVPTLVPVPGTTTDITWTDIFIGPSSQFAFALLSDGTSWSWGDGRTGTLAIDSLDVSFKPEQMLAAQNWHRITGGASQALGITYSGLGYAWGTGNEGQLGTGGMLNISVGPVKIFEPVPEDGVDGGNGFWSDVCAALEQSCGIYNGDAYCWGASMSGLLGSPGGDTGTPRLVQGKGTWGVRPFAPPPMPPLPPSPTLPPALPNAPNPPPAPPMKPAASSGASVGEIVGAAIGGIALASLLLVGYMVWRRKRRQKRAALGLNATTTGTKNDAKPNAVLLWAAHSQEIESPRSSLISLLPPSLAPLEFNWNDVEVIKPLGTGSFGAVYLANIHHTKMAVKVLVDADAVVAAAAAASHGASATGGAASDSSEQEGSNSIKTKSKKDSFVATPVPRAHVEKMLQEASLMATLQHPNVVHLLGFCIAPPCMAVEYCPRGSLYDVLAQARTDPESAKRLTWIRRLRMAKDVAAGLLHLHSRTPPILHRDIKSPNILVTADFTVKVADMGLSKLAEEAQGGSKISTLGGGANPRWLAPEILDGNKASMESDVFAFGVVLWEMLTWTLPWSEDNVWAVSSAVLRNERPEIPPLNQLPGFDKEMSAAQEANVYKYIELMKRCWAQDPAQRPDFSVVAMELGDLLQEAGGAAKSKKLLST